MCTLQDVLNLISKVDVIDERGSAYKIMTRKQGRLSNPEFVQYKEYVSSWEIYKSLQHFGFNLDSRKVKISQELADFLTDKYQELRIKAEYEKRVDLSGDYIMNFECFVKGKESTPRCW